ncbi:MAG: alpha/beta hydrolase [Geminicoccaceae bacterium]
MATPAPVFVSTYGRTAVRGQETVILVHGAGMDQSVWLLQGRYLAFHGWNALAVDLPGHGRSKAQPVLTSIPAMADWLAELIASIDQGPATLIGHSMGALASLCTAARHPERVARLCLLGAAASMPVHPALLELTAAGDPKGVGLICDWAFGTRAQLGGNAQPGGWLVGTAKSLLLRGSEAVLDSDLRACAAYADGPADAARVRCPTLLVLGSDDKMTPAKGGYALAKLIPGARTVEIQEAGHMMMVETPEAVREALTGFLRAPSPAT